MVATRFGDTAGTVSSLVRDAKARKLELFPGVRKGPQRKQTPAEIQAPSIAYRRQGLSCLDIQDHLAEDGIPISARTGERLLKAAGFGSLKRRNRKEPGRTLTNTILPERAEPLNVSELSPFSVDCPPAGVFVLIPSIVDSGVLNIVSHCQLPESSCIGAPQAGLSMLLVTLIGGKRLRHLSM